MTRMMKRLMLVVALAAAVSFAAPPASAVDAHHPATQTTKAKKAKKPAAKSKAKPGKRSGMPMMNCPMMAGGTMNCPMMRASGMKHMGRMHGMHRGMMTSGGMARGMHHGEAMMNDPGRCQTMTDRERGFGYWGACSR